MDYAVYPFVPFEPYSSSISESRAGSPSVYYSGYHHAAPPSSIPFPPTHHFADVYHHNQCDLPSTTLGQIPSSYWSNQNIGYPQTQSVQPEFVSAPDDVPLHAPVPLPGYTPLLTRTDSIQNIGSTVNNSSCCSSPYVSTIVSPPPPPPASTPHKNQTFFLVDDLAQFPQHQEMLNFYAKASEQTFPTPSELLSQLTGARPLCPLPPSSGSISGGTTAAIEPEKKFESQRKARHRAVAQSVGFEPTDPDTISSHDKKRHYLECLEAYVSYLHEQLSLVGDPLPLERVSTYRGLSSRSIRTLLVYMENTVRKLHLKTVDEEQTFLKLRDQLLAQETWREDFNHTLPAPQADDATDIHTHTHRPYTAL